MRFSLADKVKPPQNGLFPRSRLHERGDLLSTCTYLTYISPSKQSAITIGVYLALIPPSFFAQRYLTFRSQGPVLNEIASYFLVQIAAIVISTILLTRLVTNNPIVNSIVFLTIGGIAAVLSYVVCNGLVFSLRTKQSTN